MEVEYKLGDIVKLRHLPAHPNTGIDDRALLQVLAVAVEWFGFVGWMQKAEWWADKMNTVIERMGTKKDDVESCQKRIPWKRANDDEEDDL
jgi:hypothetical protein